MLREERYNYRVFGRLPAGWKRDKQRLTWIYAIDDIPHAYVHFVRERVSGTVDVEAELVRRRERYRFPAAKDPVETVREIQWAGRDAWQFEHSAKVHGLDCKRIVRALFTGGVWYECIETHHGPATPAARAGFASFRNGFRLLVQPVPEDERQDNAARAFVDGTNGFRLDKPKGYVRIEVNPGADPGCRVAFRRRGPTAGQQVTIRLFEYGVRKQYEPLVWLDRFAEAFGRSHAKVSRESWKPPTVDGAEQVHGTRLRGSRDGAPVVTEIALWQSRSGRVIGYRMSATGDAETTHRQSIRALIESIRLTD
ncbi:MAG: hypothetical protein AAGD14_15485 [Planctomycetota bacterium]